MRWLMTGVLLLITGWLILMSEASAGKWTITGNEARLYDITGTVMIAVDKGPDGKGLPSVHLNDLEFCYSFKPGELEVRQPVLIQGIEVNALGVTCTDDEKSVFFPLNSSARDIFIAPIMANEDIVMTLETGRVIFFNNQDGREAVNQIISLEGDDFLSL